MHSDAFFWLMKKWMTIGVIGFSTWMFGQLPQEWQGNYYGTLHVNTVQGDTLSYAMGLEIHNLSDTTVSWVIIYGADSLRDERNYVLKSAGNNQYGIDEMNGIVLSCSLIGNQLISVFEVQGNLIHAIYTCQKGEIHFNLISSANRTDTGNVNDSTNLNAIPLVYTYQTTTSQMAVLKRTKKKK